jgi:hypothetical protein
MWVIAKLTKSNHIVPNNTSRSILLIRGSCVMWNGTYKSTS